MIQITGIPRLNPYHRKSAIADYLQCPGCSQIYQPAQRLTFCPHPIISPSRLFPADTQIAIRVRNPTKVKRPPLVLEDPYYFLQDNEDPLRHEGLKIWIQGGLGCTLTAVAQKWRKHYSFVRRIAKEDKWEVRRQAYFREQERIQHIETQRILKKDTADMLKVVRARLRMLAVEASTRLKLIESGKGERMTESEFDNAMDKAVKLYRLLQEQSTENIDHDTPDLKRERKFRGAVMDAQDMLRDLLAANPDATGEAIERFRNESVNWAATLSKIDRSELSAAIGEKVDESSTAEN